MRVTSMRFENSATQALRVYARHLNDLIAGGSPRDNANTRHRNSRNTRQEPDNRVIGFAIHRGRGYLQLPAFAVFARELCDGRACADFKCDSRLQ